MQIVIEVPVELEAKLRQFADQVAWDEQKQKGDVEQMLTSFLLRELKPALMEEEMSQARGQAQTNANERLKNLKVKLSR